MKCNQSRPGFELVSPCPFPTTIMTTPYSWCTLEVGWDRAELEKSPGVSHSLWASSVFQILFVFFFFVLMILLSPGNVHWDMHLKNATTWGLTSEHSTAQQNMLLCYKVCTMLLGVHGQQTDQTATSYFNNSEE